MEMSSDFRSRTRDPLYGTRLILLYIAVLTTLSVVITALQPGGPF